MRKNILANVARGRSQKTGDHNLTFDFHLAVLVSTGQMDLALPRLRFGESSS
jgi:hypothetical protein